MWTCPSLASRTRPTLFRERQRQLNNKGDDPHVTVKGQELRTRPQRRSWGSHKRRARCLYWKTLRRRHRSKGLVSVRNGTFMKLKSLTIRPSRRRPPVNESLRRHCLDVDSETERLHEFMPGDPSMLLLALDVTTTSMEYRAFIVATKKRQVDDGSDSIPR
jgi:hypothetical protein